MSCTLNNHNPLIDSLVPVLGICGLLQGQNLQILCHHPSLNKTMAKTLRNMKRGRLISLWKHDFINNKSRCTEPLAFLQGIKKEYTSCRVMCTKTDSKEKGYIYIDNKMSSEAIENSAWACRLANENGYLSWCRNSYLMTGVGVGMLYKGQTAVAELAGYSSMLLAGVNVSWGTYIFIYNLIFLKDRVGMTGGFVALQSLAAILHAIVYVMVLIVFAAESDKYFQKHSKENQIKND
ncbi:uncharacterized protein LOC133183251 isoform X2 [Saccostrea echinata]|uniref:uncharacterized protein LOC133183251 isoform X2 n=1 Tax=Saccostrea echinata TaxID=191078 RepID=UPI002A82CC28|nr:uncharacterized protein LOC133183251 isoform X2 [Saccostrea echinata]